MNESILSTIGHTPLVRKAMQPSVIGRQGLRLGRDGDKLARQSPAPPGLGLVLVNSSFRPLFANHEAVTILTYPGPPQGWPASFGKKIRRELLRAQGSSSNPNVAAPVIQFKSERRSYFCRAFLLNERQTSKDAMLLIVLERGMSASLALSQVSQQFRLTQREQETMTLLLQGLANKEMADRMRVTPNTVKVFLRLVMTKMGVTSRCAIAAKVLDIVVSSPQLGAGLAPRDGGPASMNQSLSDGAARLLHRFNR